MNESKFINFQMTFAGGIEGELSTERIIPLPSRVLEMTRGVAEGNEEAAREFFEMFADRLFRYLLVMARGDEEMAREAVSAAMIRAMRKMKPMRTEADAWRWLSVVGRNCFLDLWRKRQRSGASEEIPASAAAPEVDRTLEEALDESMEELSVEEREMVERFYFEKQSQQKVAAGRGTSRKAVESKLARIREKLRAAVLRRLK